MTKSVRLLPWIAGGGLAVVVGLGLRPLYSDSAQPPEFLDAKRQIMAAWDKKSPTSARQALPVIKEHLHGHPGDWRTYRFWFLTAWLADDLKEFFDARRYMEAAMAENEETTWFAFDPIERLNARLNALDFERQMIERRNLDAKYPPAERLWALRAIEPCRRDYFAALHRRAAFRGKSIWAREDDLQVAYNDARMFDIFPAEFVAEIGERLRQPGVEDAVEKEFSHYGPLNTQADVVILLERAEKRARRRPR